MEAPVIIGRGFSITAKSYIFTPTINPRPTAVS